jgi:hypothetical protein
MTSYPKEFANTVEDMKRMLVEQDVRIWIQLSPASLNGELDAPNIDGSTKSFCEVFPLKYLNFSQSSVPSVQQKGVSNFRYVHNKDRGLFNMTYTLTAFVRREHDISSDRNSTGSSTSTGSSHGTIVESVFDPMLIVDRMRRNFQVRLYHAMQFD